MKKPRKLRCSVPMSKEIYETIDMESKKIGVSMSVYCSVIIGNYCMATSNVYKMINDKINLSPNDFPKEEDINLPFDYKNE